MTKFTDSARSTNPQPQIQSHKSLVKLAHISPDLAPVCCGVRDGYRLKRRRRPSRTPWPTVANRPRREGGRRRQQWWQSHCSRFVGPIRTSGSRALNCLPAALSRRSTIGGPGSAWPRIDVPGRASPTIHRPGSGGVNEIIFRLFVGCDYRSLPTVGHGWPRADVATVQIPQQKCSVAD
jgi:hypothetical protein